MGIFSVASSSFENGKFIPSKFSCVGKDISPQLSWKNAPDGTKSFAIIVNDPDAPSGNWIHWVIYDIGATVNSIKESESKNMAAFGAVSGVNDFGKIGYNGPCPPPGHPHRYLFTVYALDKLLEKRNGITAERLQKMMKGHILAKSSYMGLFSR